ncbi:DUF6777 domain-containing protein [Streptomyces sp. NPDC001691]|uniref:DUF6777 domain-containing protein n=1 Tax=unclassified Streptomyces TaxID=2593676 RepID=UPI000DE9DABB|nr:DUF6777 domain-containing protein [Streptomyces sp. SDr-06]RCH65649.1 hypothetical protein DT019_26400 [Streptomyces sp. SDr-06]
MSSTLRRIAAAAAVLSVGAFAAGCGGGATGADSEQDLNLQPIAAAGPDPFTGSTARSTATPTPAAPPGTASNTPTPGFRSARTVSGSTPGLYGGTQSVASCDVEKQIRFLGGDRAKNRAFAEAAGIDPGSVAGFLRGLTPVVLREDTRVTNHGFRDGSATSFQSVLQAGTAVLIDDHGAPRVRCACGNPLKPPNTHQGGWNDKGKPWPGFRGDRVIEVRPTTVIINNFIIVNITNNTWIERKSGDDGRHDRERPDIHIDPNKPPVTEPPTTPPASPSTSPPISSPPPSSGCPTPTPTVTVTETPTATPPQSAPAAPPTGSAAPSGCPTATTTVTATPSVPVPGPSTPSPPGPSTPPDTGVPSEPVSPPTSLPSGPESDLVGQSPESENV